MFYLTTHSTHFNYGYMASDMVKDHSDSEKGNLLLPHTIGFSYRLTARVLLYAPSHRQDNTYYGLCYTSRGALAGTRNSSMGPPHEVSIRRPIATWANALPLSYVPLPQSLEPWKDTGRYFTSGPNSNHISLVNVQGYESNSRHIGIRIFKK